MASISGICSSPSTPSLKQSRLKPLLRAGHSSVSFPARPLRPGGSSRVQAVQSAAAKVPLEKNPAALWGRYVEWLYQHKELGIFLDVSRVGFSEEFVAEMEPRLRNALRAMDELERGAIANPDEGRMVGHYWLRNPDLAPTTFLKSQIEKTLDSISSFADDIVSGEVSQNPRPNGLSLCEYVLCVNWGSVLQIKTPSGEKFTQILSVGIGGSALGPQFVAEALAPDNPPLKVRTLTRSQL